METIDLSGSLGLIETVVLTVNVLLGMLLSTAYKTKKWWQQLPPVIRKLNINDIHNYTAYIVAGLVLVHFLIIPLDPSSHFKWMDLAWPTGAPHQPYMVLLGAVSFLALLVVIITTQKTLKKNLGFRLWKNIHLIAYPLCLLFIIHGIKMDPELKDSPTDWLDGEKLLSELCGLILLAATIIRYRYHLKNIKK